MSAVLLDLLRSRKSYGVVSLGEGLDGHIIATASSHSCSSQQSVKKFLHKSSGFMYNFFDILSPIGKYTQNIN